MNMIIPNAKQIKAKSRMLRKLSCVAGLMAALVLIQNQSANLMRRELSSYQTCDITTISLPTQPIIPIFAASYPGSGAQMAHYLYEALTGLEAGDEWLHRGDTYDHVTIKTHFPARTHEIEGHRLMQRVILLLRNPLHSIPSYHNYIYEKDHHLPDHSVQAPVEAWLEWRDEHFDEEIQSWKNHLLHWMSEFEKKNRLVVSYERLVSEKMGPVESTRIANFLGRTKGVEVVPPSHVPCVWDKVVNYKRVEVDEEGNEIDEDDERKLAESELTRFRLLYDEHGKQLSGNNKLKKKAVVRRRVKWVSHEHPDHPEHSKREGHKKYKFTKRQLDMIRSTLNMLRGKFLGEYTLVVILSGYIEQIDEELKKAK